MDPEEQIKLQIEKLKDEKDNIKFGYSTYIMAYFAIVIFFGTTCVTTLLNGPDRLTKIVYVISILMLLVILYLCFEIVALNPRLKILNHKAKEIESLYEQLLEPSNHRKS